MGIVLTQGLKKQRFDASTEPKVRRSSRLGCAKKDTRLLSCVFLVPHKAGERLWRSENHRFSLAQPSRLRRCRVSCVTLASSLFRRCAPYGKPQVFFGAAKPLKASSCVLRDARKLAIPSLCSLRKTTGFLWRSQAALVVATKDAFVKPILSNRKGEKL